MKTDSEGDGNGSGRDDGDREDDESVENEDEEENEAKVVNSTQLPRKIYPIHRHLPNSPPRISTTHVRES